jgi:hypothetical protein
MCENECWKSELVGAVLIMALVSFAFLVSH